jgi:ABC-type glycerol-3-phosphate transport system substrate-binding protein
LLILSLLVLMVLSGCGGATPTAEAPVEETVQATLEAGGSAADPTTEALPEEAQGPQGTTVTWWTTPQFAPVGEDEASQILAQHLAQLSEANPNIEVEAILKAPSGQGGVLDFLLTAQKAAPAILPDVVALNGNELGVALRAGLLQPMDGLLPEDLINDLYPFATEGGMVEDSLYAVQFESDIEHLIVDSDRVQQPPRTLADVLVLDRTYVFSPGPQDTPSDGFLIQYLGAGGQIGGPADPFVLDDSALFQVLSFYEQGRNRDVIPSSVLTLDSTEAAWPVFAEGRADMAHVRSSRYLAERSRLPNTAFAALPGTEANPINISRGWALAIVTPDPERQVAAAQLISALLDPTLMASWTQASDRLPTRRSALDQWDQDDPYVSFVRGQLEVARGQLASSSYREAAPILSEAQRSVLSETATAREATERAVEMSLP